MSMLESSQDEAPPRILVVDDEAVICDILQDFLEYEGFKVSTAQSGEAAVETLTKHTYDLVLTDLKMPGIGGLEILHHVVDSEHDTMAIIMTGYGTVETAIEAMKKGAFDYILKPFKPEEVVQVLRRGLEKQRLERENVELRQSIGFYELSEALASGMPLDDQLELVVQTVAENFGVQAVEIITETEGQGGAFHQRASLGPQPFVPKLKRIIDHFDQGSQIVVDGDDVREFLENAATAEHRVSAFASVPLRTRGENFGMLNVYGLSGGRVFHEADRKGLAIFASRAAGAIETHRMYSHLEETFTQTMEGFARAIEAKDPYTGGHSDRVAMYSRVIAEAMGLSEKACGRIQHGGLMHDIGKIGIGTSDLNKPQKLTPDEYKMFQSHPVVGKRIIEPITFLNDIVPCVYHHHESWDGRGYPLGLGGKDIPEDARILSVADSYDAMTSNRPYRKALPHDIALMEFKRCAGRQFDPEVVEAFLSAIGGFRRERREKGLHVPE